MQFTEFFFSEISTSREEATADSTSGLDDTLDKFDVEDMDIEPEDCLEPEKAEDCLELEQVPDLDCQASCSEFQNPIFKAPLPVDKDPLQKVSPEKVKGVTQMEVKPKTVELDFRSLIAAAKTFKKEEKRTSKSVRFITPKKSDVVTYDGDDDLKENDKRHDAFISVNIPVND